VRPGLAGKARARLLPPYRVATRVWLTCVAGLFLVWALIYLPALRTSPRWYGDEFVTLMAGWSILDGDFANRALKYSFFSVFTNYQPWSCALFALASRLFSPDVDILGARLLAATFGLLTAVTAFHLLFRRGRMNEGIAAGLVVLCAPEAVIHYRWVYPHLIVGLAVVIIGLLLDRPATHRRAWAIGAACALAATAHLLVVHVTFAAVLVHLRRPSAWLRIMIPPGLVLLASLLFGYAIAGQQLFKDLGEVAAEYTSHGGHIPWTTKLRTPWIFFTWDWLHHLYVAALVILLVRKRWSQVIFVGYLAFAVLQNRPELPNFYYQAMIFAPVMGVYLACAAQIVWNGLLRANPIWGGSRWAHRVAAAIVPLFLIMPAVRASLSGKIISRNDALVAPSISDLERTAAWVNARTAESDLVIAFWDLGWLLKARWTDLMQAAVWRYGVSPAFYTRHRDRGEFLFPADLNQARYVVVGPLDMVWAAHQGTVPKMIEETRLQQWPVAARTGTTLILANPRFGPPDPSAPPP
jgi:hypothetical protein